MWYISIAFAILTKIIVCIVFDTDVDIVWRVLAEDKEVAKMGVNAPLYM